MANIEELSDEDLKKVTGGDVKQKTGKEAQLVEQVIAMLNEAKSYSDHAYLNGSIDLDITMLECGCYSYVVNDLNEVISGIDNASNYYPEAMSIIFDCICIIDFQLKCYEN